ncbi:MAG: fructose-2,6-bisphosphatase [Actinobacteria bacterium]|nr:fructose-2,6-bisphosphatase [Actinomycetota bacterium]
MATIYLLRHAESSANNAGILAGRLPSISLSRAGKVQSRAIVKTLKDLEITHIYSSPIQRCLETIEPFAKSSNSKVTSAPNFIEMDYGDWSGRKLSALRREKLWKSIQKRPSTVRFPNGESFQEMQARIQKGLNDLARKHKKGRVLIVSHGDPIKVVIASALGMNLDDFQKIVVDPASLTIIDWPSGTLLGSNIPLLPIKKKTAKRKAGVTERRVLGGGTNV